MLVEILTSLSEQTMEQSIEITVFNVTCAVQITFFSTGPNILGGPYMHTASHAHWNVIHK